jgi:poly(beta-D-mannuronate) lyase
VLNFSKGISSIYHYEAESPAINKGEGTYPYVGSDIDGQPRNKTLDKGADEFSSVQIINMQLMVDDVGPLASLNN